MNRRQLSHRVLSLQRVGDRGGVGSRFGVRAAPHNARGWFLNNINQYATVIGYDRAWAIDMYEKCIALIIDYGFYNLK